ncbi:hypothetical protein F4813DRAFT_394432 [Daldinia decipiens]|uniref:uncharacterized protein n=1 Tax=Daldinia decipiens TaxID=326647 RepID=UPI0020C50F74|nr:uncharacterized protein F4813DRAFT_394432 [Daldinia decipiens]KAI1652703.1 hypothetical protein F4813DRAFT_394432 [Daldinia decipiens]
MAPSEKYPYYKIHDKQSGWNGSFKVYTILIDSDDGRAYEKLSTDSERLDYMRKHAHDSWNVVRPDAAFYEDHELGKRYTIKINSPEYERLQKMMRKDGECPDEGTKEFDDMLQYYKDHATSVEDIPVGSRC